jgi:hypothetical protein
VFRGVYLEEIHKFGVKVLRKEYNEELKKEKKWYKRLLEKYCDDERWLETGKLTQ